MVLPAPLGPMSPTISPCSHVDVHGVQCGDAGEALRDAARLEELAARARVASTGGSAHHVGHSAPPAGAGTTSRRGRQRTRAPRAARSSRHRWRARSRPLHRRRSTAPTRSAKIVGDEEHRPAARREPLSKRLPAGGVGERGALEQERTEDQEAERRASDGHEIGELSQPAYRAIRCTCSGSRMNATRAIPAACPTSTQSVELRPAAQPWLSNQRPASAPTDGTASEQHAARGYPPIRRSRALVRKIQTSAYTQARHDEAEERRARAPRASAPGRGCDQDVDEVERGPGEHGHDDVPHRAVLLRQRPLALRARSHAP